MRYDKHGRELPDKTPVAIPIKFKKPQHISDTIKRLVRTTMSDLAEEKGLDSLEDADDFDTGENDIEPYSPYEIKDLEGWDEVKRKHREAKNGDKSKRRRGKEEGKRKEEDGDVEGDRDSDRIDGEGTEQAVGGSEKV